MRVCSCGSVYNGETKKKIINRSIEHQQESIKCNWSSLEQPECQGMHKEMPEPIWMVTPQTLSMKNRYFDWKVRESLEIDINFRYGQDKVLSRDSANFFKTNAWKPLLKKMKTLHWNLTSFCIKDGSALFFDQFDKGLNQCGRNITVSVIKLLQWFWPILIFNIYQS